MIYLDNAATTMKKPQVVIDAVTNAMQHFGNANRGLNDVSLSASRTIYLARVMMNELLNGVSANQIAFSMNATESLNTAIKGLLKSGDHVITTKSAHNSVLRPLYEMQQQGVELTILPVGTDGRVAEKVLVSAITDNTKVLILTHASNLTGDIERIESLILLAKEYGIMTIVDAAQTCGAIPIDVQQLGADVVCFTGHKSLLGPQGTGGLYVAPNVHIAPLKTGGSGTQTFSKQHPETMPDRLEAGTLNSHGLAGLLSALDYLKSYTIQRIQQEEEVLHRYFVEKLQNIPDVTLYGDVSNYPRCPIVALNIGDMDSRAVAMELMERGEIMTRAGGHCAPLMHETLGTVEQGVVRFSLSHYTTYEELDKVIAIIQEIQAER